VGQVAVFASRTGLDLAGGDLADNIARGQVLWLSLRDAVHSGERADKEDEKTAAVWRKHAKRPGGSLADSFGATGLPIRSTFPTWVHRS
jgi:hypothetical protein